MSLSAMMGEFADAREQQWTRRDGFQSSPGMRQGHEYTPPVVDYATAIALN